MVKSGNLSFFQHILVSKQGNNHKCPTRGGEKGHLQTERRVLEDILANSPDCLLAVFFGDIFQHYPRESI